jgi:hypothetical protein
VSAHPLTPQVQKALGDILDVYTEEQTAFIEELDRVYGLMTEVVNHGERSAAATT